MTASRIIEQADPWKAMFLAKLEARGQTPQEFLKEFFGLDDKGQPKGGGILYGWFKVHGRMRDATRAKLAEYFGCPAEDFAPMEPQVVATKVKKGKGEVTVVTRTPQLPGLEGPAPQPPQKAARMTQEPPPQFSFVIDATGEASLSLNLRLPAAAGIKALSVLQAAGLLPSDPSP